MTVESSLSLRMWVGCQEAAGTAEVLRGRDRFQGKREEATDRVFVGTWMEPLSVRLSGKCFGAPCLQARAGFAALGSVFSSHRPGMGLPGALTLCLVCSHHRVTPQ